MSGDRDPKARVAWAALILFIAGLVLPFIFYAIFVSSLLGWCPALIVRTPAPA